MKFAFLIVALMIFFPINGYAAEEFNDCFMESNVSAICEADDGLFYQLVDLDGDGLVDVAIFISSIDSTNTPPPICEDVNGEIPSQCVGSDPYLDYFSFGSPEWPGPLGYDGYPSNGDPMFFFTPANSASP